TLEGKRDLLTEKTALDYLGLAVDRHFPEAAFFVGGLFEKGMGFRKSGSRAWNYFTLAASWARPTINPNLPSEVAKALFRVRDTLTLEELEAHLRSQLESEGKEAFDDDI
ncbi:MAG: hypothetical protein L0Y56_12930, partial [Nitrospira sp.]|nr:hypothetical protein [Nitrospira sp.]